MDDLDRRLIGLLRENARTPVAALAKSLRVSRGTVQNRMAKLEADGTIVGYSVRVRPQVEERSVRGVMTIEVEGNKVDGVLKTLRGDPEIVGLHTTNGRWDIVAELRVESLEAFDRLLLRVGRLDGVTSSETSLLLSSYKL